MRSSATAARKSLIAFSTALDVISSPGFLSGSGEPRRLRLNGVRRASLPLLLQELFQVLQLAGGEPLPLDEVGEQRLERSSEKPLQKRLALRLHAFRLGHRRLVQVKVFVFFHAQGAFFVQAA